jgi:hypothetical protein
MKMMSTSICYPIFNEGPQSWNLYSYVRNRPTRFVDGNGLWPVLLQIVADGFGRVNP